MRIENLDSLLSQEDTTSSIIEIDDFICGLSFDEMTASQRVFHYIQELEREVNSGGFNQYFINSSGDYAMYAVDALKKVGALKTAAIVQSAIDQFPGSNVPEDRDERIEMVEKIEGVATPIWNELDQKFSLYEDDLNELNIEFIRKNRNEF